MAFNFDCDYWLDVHAFEGGDLDRYRGELLEGLQVRDACSYEHWLLVQRESYKAKYQEGLEAHLEMEKEAGNAAVVEETAVKLLALDNLREDWHRELMGAFAQQGKFEAALAQYDLCRNILRKESYERFAADGTTPWCISINSGEATGWVGTDWLEDILLRTAPPEVYDAWVAGELPFDSPEIRRAWGIMSEIWMNDRYTYGAAETIISERFFENPMHMFSEPPQCYLHRQGSFITLYFPEGSQFGMDYDFFFLPPIDEEFSNPVLGAGDIMAMFNDRPEVRETMKYFTKGESIRHGIENGVVIAPHRDVPLEWYNGPVNLKIAQILLEADTYRFDGSDMMPGVVGTGSFWKGVADWVEGKELDTALPMVHLSKQC